jgi:hypothetical protein
VKIISFDQMETLLAALLISSKIVLTLWSRLCLDVAEIRCRRCMLYYLRSKSHFMALLIVLDQTPRSLVSLRMFRPGFRDSFLRTISTSFWV